MILIKDLARLSYTKLRVRRKRMWFTIVGVGLGVGLVALATTLIYNGKQLMLKKSAEQLFDLTIIQTRIGHNYVRHSKTISLAGPEEANYLSDEDVKKIKELLPMAFVSEEIDFWLNIFPKENFIQDFNTLNTHSPEVLVKIGEKEEENYNLGWNITGLDEKIFQRQRQLFEPEPNNVIPILANPYLMNSVMKTDLNSPLLFEESDYAQYLGKTFTLNFAPGYIGEKPKDYVSRDLTFKVVGITSSGSYIFKEKARELRQWFYDETLKNIPLEMREKINLEKKPNQYETIDVVVNTIEEVKNAAQLLEASGFYTYSYATIAEEIANVFRYVYYAVITAGSVVILIVMFIVMNTIGKMVSDSTKEIGIFKTLGASRWDIRKIFMTQSFIISGIGGLIGVILGYLGAPLAVYLFLNFISRLDPLEETPLTAGKIAREFLGIPWLQLTILCLATVIICTLVSFGRSQRAAKLDPVQALKEEI